MEIILNQALALEHLRDLSRIAYDLFTRNQHYTFEDVATYFEVLTDAVGPSEASGFLNLCLETERKGIAFPDAVLETIAMQMEPKHLERENFSSSKP